MVKKHSLGLLDPKDEALSSIKTLETAHPMTWHQTIGNFGFQQHRCENIISHDTSSCLADLLS